MNHPLLALDAMLLQAHRLRLAANWSEAAAAYRACLARQPDSPELLHNLALCLHASGRHADALPLCRRALAARPQLWQSAVLLGQALQASGDPPGADQAYLAALRAQPGQADALLGRADLAMNSFGDPLQASVLVVPLLADPEHRRDALLTTLMASLYDRDEDALMLNRRIIEFSRAYLRLDGWDRAPLPPRGPGARRQRIGILSPLLCAGPVYFLTIAAWRRAARQGELIVFQRGTRQDWASDELGRLAHEWHEAHGFDALQLARALHDADLDVLYDLGGWMDPIGLQALSVKPARRQYKWVGGQSVTTGLSSFDGWVGDEAQSPLRLQPLYTEPLLNLAGGYANYTPPPYLPAPAARKRSEPVIFANPAKLSRAFLQHLAARPGRKVFVHRQYQYPQVRERIERVLDPASVEYVCPATHLEALQAVNQHAEMLDTFPYSSGLTAREAIAMGTRVIGHGGTLFCERHTAALTPSGSAVQA